MSEYLNFPTNRTIVLVWALAHSCDIICLGLCTVMVCRENMQCVRLTMGVKLGMVSAFVCNHSESGKQRERESVFYYKGTTGGSSVMYNK